MGRLVQRVLETVALLMLTALVARDCRLVDAHSGWLLLTVTARGPLKAAMNNCEF